MTARVEGYEVDVSPIVENDAPFHALLGLEWDLFSPDRVEAHLDVREELHQPYGLVHGGVLSALVEGVGSFAAAMRAIEDGKVVVGVHNATHFLRAVRTGRVEIVATPIHVGRLQQLWLVVITRDDGKVAARGELRLQVLDRPPGS